MGRARARILMSRIVPYFVDKNVEQTCIILGDLNSDKSNGAPSVFQKHYKDASGVMEKGSLGCDAFTYVGFDPSSPCSSSGQIDWTFVKNHEEISNYVVHTDDVSERNRRLSDHHPISAMVFLS